MASAFSVVGVLFTVKLQIWDECFFCFSLAFLFDLVLIFSSGRSVQSVWPYSWMSDSWICESPLLLIIKEHVWRVDSVKMCFVFFCFVFSLLDHITNTKTKKGSIKLGTSLHHCCTFFLSNFEKLKIILPVI